MNELLVFEMSLRIVAMMKSIEKMDLDNILTCDYVVTHEKSVLGYGEDLMDEGDMKKQAYLRN